MCLATTDGIHLLRVCRRHNRGWPRDAQTHVRRSSEVRGPLRGPHDARQIAPDRDRGQRQRALHALLPHRAKIRQQRQPLRLVSESPFVNQHAAVYVSAKHGILDLVEPHRHSFEAAQQVQQQRRGRALAGNRHPAADGTSGSRRRQSGPHRIRRRLPHAIAHTDRVSVAYAAMEIFVTSASPRSARALSASTSSMCGTTRGPGTRPCTRA